MDSNYLNPEWVLPDGVEVYWRPTCKQTQALKRLEFEILYGGARGGGKTDAGQAFLTYHVEKPHYRALVIRENATDLADWIDRARLMYVPHNAVVKGASPEIHFPSGAIIRTGHLKDDKAYTKYQGHEYHNILIEELTQIPTERRYQMLVSSCRSTDKDIPAQVFCTANPGNVGHEWVVKRWQLDNPDTYGKPITDKDSGRKRIFIQATITDNPHLMEADPEYAKYLESLPENLRRAWRYGEWDNFEVDGAYYGKIMQNLRDRERITAVPYEPSALVHTSWDLGVNDLMSIWFFQIINNEYRYINFYQNSGEGLPHYASVLEKMGYEYGKFYFPHDMKVKEFTGTTRLELAEKLGMKPAIVAPRISLADGIEAVRHLLHKSYFDIENCAEGITCLQNYRKEWDDKLGTFKNYPLHDKYSHGADAFRTFAQSDNKDQLRRKNLRNPNADWNPGGSW